MGNMLAFVGVVFIAILCIMSYTPIKARLLQADFQSLSYGPALTAFLPVFLAFFGVMFGLVTMYACTSQGYGGKKK